MPPEPFYLVTGPHRSGTSMMMRTLRDSGLPINYVAEADFQLANTIKLVDKSYAPNPFGFFEKGRFEEGKAVKRISRALLTTKLPGPTHIVRMSRPKAERRQSLSKWGFKGSEMISRLEESDYLQKFYNFNRNNILSLTRIEYADMVSYPLVELNRLVEAGWNLPNIEEGAKVPTPDLYRHRANAHNAQV
jgi:hypothetical protein